ncbi:TPA: hypothetical protein N0F65_004719 [Lagenidium giganteum]|uniref:Ketoreductase domain-containing protein n=1 Tax=Lagenidium giganteum TaxID=4803 RepID=A0AAV2Z5L1_9STRA|nr:TPA: hypothetical protein N0F65_004719 [Lagenidium giganteum]
MEDVNAILPVVVAVVAVAVSLWLVLRAARRPFNLDGKVIVITGAASGIGRCLACMLHARTREATLVLLDIDAVALKSLQSQLEANGSKGAAARVRVYECDVSSDSHVKETIARVLKDVAPKPVAVLVNNAGVVNGKRIADLAPADVKKTFGVNVFAHYWLVMELLPSLKSAPEALIVTISSVMSFAPSVGLSDYCASKAAVSSFHDSLRVIVILMIEPVRMELWREQMTHVRTLVVCPGAVDTGMFEGIFDGASLMERFAKAFITLLPVETVARNIYTAMVRGDEKIISCANGWRGLLFPWLPVILQVLPVPLSDRVIALAGGYRGMDTFVGRHKASTNAKK